MSDGELLNAIEYVINDYKDYDDPYDKVERIKKLFKNRNN